MSKLPVIIVPSHGGSTSSETAIAMRRKTRSWWTSRMKIILEVIETAATTSIKVRPTVAWGSLVWWRSATVKLVRDSKFKGLRLHLRRRHVLVWRTMMRWAVWGSFAVWWRHSSGWRESRWDINSGQNTQLGHGLCLSLKYVELFLAEI